MADSDILEEPPDENEAFANVDESLDDEDARQPGRGPEGERDLDTDLVVDESELEEVGANLDDPDRISILDGGLDDPDGSGPPEAEDDEAGWDVDPVTRDQRSADDDYPDADPDFDRGEGDRGDGTIDMDIIPDDASGLDGGR